LIQAALELQAKRLMAFTVDWAGPNGAIRTMPASIRELHAFMVHQGRRIKGRAAVEIRPFMTGWRKKRAKCAKNF